MESIFGNKETQVALISKRFSLQLKYIYGKLLLQGKELSR
jgi:hypothetical protein